MLKINPSSHRLSHGAPPVGKTIHSR